MKDSHGVSEGVEDDNRQVQDDAQHELDKVLQVSLVVLHRGASTAVSIVPRGIGFVQEFSFTILDFVPKF